MQYNIPLVKGDKGGLIRRNKKTNAIYFLPQQARNEEGHKNIDY